MKICEIASGVARGNSGWERKGRGVEPALTEWEAGVVLGGGGGLR